MRNALQKMEDMLEAIIHLEENEIDFLSSYLRDISHELRHFHHGHNQRVPDLPNLWDSFGSTSYTDYACQLLHWVYDNDDYHMVSDICGYLFSALPNTKEIKEILLKGIWDTQKSNRLRERFFWCFDHQFKESTVNFFSAELSKFIEENANNEDLMADIIDFMHWNMEGRSELEQSKQVVLKYISGHPTVREHLHPTTKKLLEIESAK